MLSTTKAGAGAEGGVQKKALIIVESAAIVGDALRELVISAQEIMSEISDDSAEFNQKKLVLDTFVSAIEEHQEFLLELDAKRHQRKLLESRHGDDTTLYEADPEWQALNQEVNELAQQETKMARNINRADQTLLDILLDAFNLKDINLLMYHAHDTGTGGASPSELIESIRSLPDQIAFQHLVIGGGHGSTKVLSGLDQDFVFDMIESLQEKGCTFQVACMGSCEGAAHMPYLDPVLTESGVAIGYLGDCTNNFILATINYCTGVTDELIEYNELDAVTEANCKAASLAVLHKNTLTAFEILPEARNTANVEFWQSTLTALHTVGLNYEFSKQYTPLKIEPRAIHEIYVLGSVEPEFLIRAFLQRSDFKSYLKTVPLPKKPIEFNAGAGASAAGVRADTDAEAIPFTLLDNKEGIAKYQLTEVEFQYDDEELEGELDAETQRDIDKYVETLPSVFLVRFGPSIQNRVVAVNQVVAKIVPPTHMGEEGVDLSSPPLTPAIAAQSIQLDPGQFKDMVSETLTPARKTLKINS